jgi:hypothetical protein
MIKTWKEKSFFLQKGSGKGKINPKDVKFSAKVTKFQLHKNMCFYNNDVDITFRNDGRKFYVRH